MDPPDDDIRFDFFDEEPATAETASQSRVRMPQRPIRPPRVRAAAGGSPPYSRNPLVRMLALMAVVILVVLFFAVVIRSCGSKSSQYSSYMTKATTIANQSTTDGQHTVAALTTAGLTVPQIVTKLQSVAAQEQQNVASAQSLTPPGRLRTVHEHLLEALELRVSGVAGLATALKNTIGSNGKESAQASALSQQAYRLLASDVVWDDLFKAPADLVLKDQGVSQVTVPESHYLASPDLVVTAQAMTNILDRLRSNNPSTGGTTGLHGTNIVSVEALPKGAGGAATTLNPASLNTVQTSSSLVIRVTINDGGNSQEVQIPVTLTIGRLASEGGPITRNAMIQLIDPGQHASVTFTDLGNVPFAERTTLRVDVARVPGETNVANNTASYNVLFSLPT